MSAREVALQDIKESLREEGKCFIAFRKNLNPIMRKLVSKHIKDQKLCI